jgi:hypothetical protein
VDKIPELKETEQRISNDISLFQTNEYLRLNGFWFTPLPCHYWGLALNSTITPGASLIIEIETDIQFTLTGNATVSGYCQGFGKNGIIIQVGSVGCITVRPQNIKKMRIVSFEVGNDA